jgi:hypothetical protein
VASRLSGQGKVCDQCREDPGEEPRPAIPRPMRGRADGPVAPMLAGPSPHNPFRDVGQILGREPLSAIDPLRTIAIDLDCYDRSGG